MSLELHVWGPGFGLPSIDAHCLGAIALFQELLPPNSWALVATSTPSTIPLGELPALKHGAHWVAGYRNIVAYLNDISTAKRSKSEHLNDSGLADSTAFCAFVESRGLPLLDLLLYVSSDNYNACTRPALGEILAWPESWILPGRLRARAKRRSEYLGLSSLDVDNADDDKSKNEGLAAQVPASLRKPKFTVSFMLGRDMNKNRFRLDAVTSEFLEPLQDALGQKRWLFGDAPSSADCLVAAVLSLMYFPSSLAHPWLKNMIDRKHPDLAGWIRQCASTWFAVRIPLSAKSGEDMATAQPPWQPSPARSWSQTLNIASVLLTEATPILGSLVTLKEVEVSVQSSHTTRQRQKQETLIRRGRQQLVYSQLWISVLCLSGLTGVLLWNGSLTLPRRYPGPRVRNFGAAGTLLGIR